MDGKFIRNVLIKTVVLLAIFALILVAFQPLNGLGKISVYNGLVPGRLRFPFGENPQQAYNLTINDLDAMFASHVISQPKAADEYRVFVLGDSSVWGTLLRPEETLAGQLNALNLTAGDGRRMVFYNIGYPTISLEKDVMILAAAMQYQPDRIIWLTTLEAFPGLNPQDSPLLLNNLDRLNAIDPRLAEGLQPAAENLLTQRRFTADWLRLQFYGVMWAATGIDQVYASDYEPASRDFEADDHFNEWTPDTWQDDLIDFTPFEIGLRVAGDVPVTIVNEPMLISSGQNSDIRYNFYYPRWVYDRYRELMAQQAAAGGWDYLDLWDIAPETEFTNSAIHLTPAGEALLAAQIAGAGGK